MRVTYISEGNIPSKFAHTFQAMKMAEALAKHVTSMTLLTSGGLLGPRGDDVDLFEWYGVQTAFRVLRLPVYLRTPGLMREGNQRRFTRTAALAARLTSPDLVYTRSKQAARYCATLGLRTILETHSNADELTRRLRGAAEHRRLLGLVTVTEHLRDEYLRAGVPAEKILVWPDAVDLRRFENLPSREAARKRLGLPLKRPILVYCGHFYDAKGVPCLIESAKHVPEVLFCLVGGWPEDVERMRRLARDRTNVRFLGFVPNDAVPLHLAAADVLALPNSARFEHARATSPLKLFEYMSAGRPLLATRIPALENVLRHGENCLLIQADSSEALAVGIRQLLTQPKQAEQIARQAAKDVCRFTWDRRAAEILEHFGVLPRPGGCDVAPPSSRRAA